VVVLEAESADEWEDVVSNCFVPLRASAFSAGFRGRMDYLRLDERVSVSVVTTDGTTANRTPQLAARAASDDLHLSLQESSKGTVRQDNRMVAVRRGSVTTYATDAPYYLDYSAPDQRQLIIQVSRAALTLPSSMIRDSCSRLALPASDASRVLYAYVAQLQKKATRAELHDPDELAEVTRDLASTMIRSSFTQGRVVPRTSTAIMITVKDFISSNVATLCVDDIAHEFYMSRRSLYNLFGATGKSPAEYLRGVRLGNAAAMLTDPQHASWSVARIAAECGFADSTTFTRAFRREFSCTPSEWRRSPDLSVEAQSLVA